MLRTALALSLAAGAASGTRAATALPGVQPEAAAPDAQPATATITGRTFSGIPVGAGVQEGAITLRAAQAATWTETESPIPGAPGATEPTRRLLLTGDVNVELGIYRFNAAQAVVWIEQIGVAEEDPSIPVYQVAVYFDRVGDPGAEAGTAAVGDRLLVTGILAGTVRLLTDAPSEGRPGAPLIEEGEARLARLLRETAGVGVAGDEGMATRVDSDPRGPIRPGVSRPFEPDSPFAQGEGAVPEESRLPESRELEPIFASDGILTLAAGDWTIAGGGEGEDAAIVVTGGAVFQYVNPGTGQSLEITAERAVLFLGPGTVAELATRFNPEDVRGLYLEGNAVATGTDPRRGTYTLRGPRMYYDMQANRAVVVDAVFWTYDERVGIPLYVRADALRQESQDQFSAQDVRLSNSAFFDPHFAIGASSITVQRRPRTGGREGEATIVSGEDLTFRFGPVPFFYWPSFKGNLDNVPLRGVGIRTSDNTGFALTTAWDPFGVLGIEAPDWLDAQLLVDGYFERGAALGTNLDWSNLNSHGGLFAYTLLNDKGTDILSSGAEVDQDGDTRALVLGDHIWHIDQYWTVQLEAAYVSDETFVDAFFRDIALNHREFTNAGYVRRQEDNTSFSVLAQASLQDFTPNHFLLQSQGFTVDRLPEVRYARVADDLLAGVAPGVVNWTQEYRLTRMQANFVEPSARELGFDTNELSLTALGILPDESIGDQLRAAGFPEDEVLRFDTRHELTVKADFGPLRLAPFVVGRFTAYDQGFEDFNGEDDEQYRVWGAAGVRASTSIQKVDDSVSSRLLDLHRIRHIIEPSATVWTAGSNLHRERLPVFDETVEGIATGSAVTTGITQTWQTKRGGPGRWRSVDVLVLRTDLTLSSDDTDRESPVPRFFDYRPEYSLFGDFATVDLRWQVTDALGLVFNSIYDFEVDQPARTIVGGTLEHTPDFRTFAELRYLNALDITYLDLGAEAQLTRKYSAAGYATYDTDAADFRSYGGVLRRRFPALTFGVSFAFDNLTDDFSVGMVIEPLGAPQGVRLDRLRQ